MKQVKIWREEFALTLGYVDVLLPRGAMPFSFDFKYGVPSVWFMFDPAYQDDMEVQRFLLMKSGVPALVEDGEDLMYVGSAMTTHSLPDALEDYPGLEHVRHLFQVVEEDTDAE
jgi:hypothetical protein